MQNKKTLIYTLTLLILMLCICIVGCSAPQQLALSAPQNLKVKNQTLSWDKVDNAVGYILVIENIEYKTTECSFDLSFLTPMTEYEIEIMSVGDGKKYTDSEWVDFDFFLEEAVEEKQTASVGYDSKGFAYRLLADGTGYAVSRGHVNLAKIEGELRIPDYFNDLPVKSISDHGFDPAFAILKVPNPFTERWCNTSITSIVLPSQLESIGRYAIIGFANLTYIDIPDSVTEIKNNAFSANPRLMNVKLPKNLKEIPTACFRNCALAEVTLPEGLEKIWNCAFMAEEVDPDDYYEAIYRPTGSDLGLGFKVYPLLRTRTAQNFSKIVIPDSVKVIGSDAFKGCIKLKEIVIREDKSDLSICSRAFDNTEWRNTLPENEVLLGNYLFDYNGELPENYTVPSSVKYIGGSVFSGSTTLKKLYIPDGVKLMGAGLVSYCTLLTDVRLPSDLTYLPESTFNLCTNLKKIEIPDSVTEIGAKAFSSSGLEELTLPEGIRSIPDYGLTYIPLLKKLTLPSTLCSIGNSALANCYALESIMLPSGLKTIGHSAFANCYALESVSLPTGLKTIGSSAFLGCTKLKEITIPHTVEELGQRPLAECKSLTSVYYEGTKEEWTALKNVNNNIAGVANGKTYYVAVPFSGADIYYYSEKQPQDEGLYWRYVDGKSTPW